MGSEPSTPRRPMCMSFMCMAPMFMLRERRELRRRRAMIYLLTGGHAGPGLLPLHETVSDKSLLHGMGGVAMTVSYFRRFRIPARPESAPVKHAFLTAFSAFS